MKTVEQLKQEKETLAIDIKALIDKFNADNPGTKLNIHVHRTIISDISGGEFENYRVNIEAIL